MKINKKYLFIILLSFVLILPMITSAAIKPPAELAQSIKDFLVTLGGVLVVVGWIVAGILYLTSGGDPSKTGTAKKAVIACVIGTVLVVLASAGYDAVKTFLSPIIGTP